MGWFATPVEHLQALVASSETFQGIVEKGDEEDAKSKVLIWTPDDTLPAEQVPRAVVGPAGNRKIRKKSTTGWEVSGGLVALFEFSVPEAQQTSRAAAYAWFAAAIDAIVVEMALKSNKDGYLNVSDFIEFEPPDFVDTDDNNGIWEMNTMYIVET